MEAAGGVLIIQNSKFSKKESFYCDWGGGSNGDGGSGLYLRK